MNKAVLILIQPYYVFLIIARVMGWDITQEKTVEVRKDSPKDRAWSRRVHIYCSKNRKSFNRIPKEYQPLMAKFLGKVIGDFVCDLIDKYEYYNELPYDKYNLPKSVLNSMCLICHDVDKYGAGKPLYGWHITDLKIYDTPKELGEFFGYGECEPDPVKCHACKYMEHGNSWAGIEADCNAAYDGLKRLSRSPQSWCYIEELSE